MRQMTHRTVRNCLSTSVTEGILAEIVTACAGGGVLTAWALSLDLSPALFGLLGALPYAAQVLQMPGAWISRHFGARRTTIAAMALSRAMLLPLVVLPFLGLGLATMQAVFLIAAFGSAAFGIIGNNGWTTWMTELVPAGLRGRYFGRRSALSAIAATGASLAAGLWLDGAHGAGASLRLSLLAGAACAVGAVATALLARQRNARGLVTLAPRLADAIAPLRQRAARRFLSFQLAFSFATGVGAAFYPLHMIGDLRMGFARMALYNAGVAAFRTLGSKVFGKALDRAGARPVLVACSIALCLSPVLWLFPTADHLWPLALDAALCGTAMAGYNLAVMALPATLASRRDRGFLFAAIATAGGFATAVASAASGGLVRFLPAPALLLGRPVTTAHALFLLGGLARAGAVLFALRLEEAGARPVVDLARMVLRREAPVRVRLAA